MRANGFRGAAYEELVKALAQYGYQVMGSWIRSGAVFRKLAEKGKAHFLARFPKRIPPLGEAREMTNDVVADAIVAFKEEVLVPGKWDHRRGASLATFFVGQCLLRFPKVYIEWLKTGAHNKQCVPPEEFLKDRWRSNTVYDDPARVAVTRDQLYQARSAAPPITREILVLVEDGYSHPEIAQMLGISVGSIESRLHRHKKACERRRLNDIA